VLLRAQKLREHEVSVTDVVSALRAQNATAPVGKVRGALEDQSIRLVGRIESPAEFGQIVIKRRGDELVRLSQVAVVQDGFAELSGFSVRSGKPNVGLSVTRTREASTVSVAKDIRALIAEMNAGNAADVKAAKAAVRDLRELGKLVVQERAHVETLRKQVAGVLGTGTDLDLDAARDEIGRRLACLRDARGD
jgi:multidrug efflux pump subunit AcrB